MFFSVIVPVYNAESSISRCLESLRNQSFPDFEAILVDDGSTDASGEICRAAAASDVRFVYVGQDNRGVSAARNAGIQMAKGEYITFLDSDDAYSVEYLQSFFDVIHRYPECDHYLCGYKCVLENGNEHAVRIWKPDSNKVSLSDRSRIMDIHGRELLAPLWNKAFRRAVVEERHLRMDESLSLGEDLLFNYAYLDSCGTQIVLLNQPLYSYSVSENDSLNRRYRANLKDIYEKLDETTFSYLGKWRVDDDQIAAYYRGVFWHYDHVLHNTYRTENTSSAIEKLRFNRSVMEGEGFHRALKYAASSVHPAYRAAYRMRSWRAVMLLDYLVNTKNNLRK